MTFRRLLARPLPWHLLLAPAFPFGALQLAHLDIMRPDGMIWPTAAAAAIALVLWVVAGCMVTNSHSAALAITISISAVLGYRGIASLAAELALPGGTLIFDVGILVALLFVIFRPSRAVFYTRWANQTSALVLALLMALMAHAEWTRPRIAAPALPEPSRGPQAERPDVYVLVLDGYGRGDVLREYYDFDNPLVTDLQRTGFFVAAQATSNYAQTALSLASALNLDYLQAITSGLPRMMSRRDMGDLIAHNLMFGLFKDAGYEIHAYASAYNLLRPGPADIRPSPLAYATSFGLAAYEATSIPVLSQFAGLERGWLPLALHRHHVRWTFDDLGRRASRASGPPRLVYAHVLAPHPPFAFAPDGTARRVPFAALGSDASHWKALASGHAETYEAGYVDAVAYVNAQVVRFVAAVLANTSRDALILVHSDHGPGAHLNWERPEASGLRERHGILLAMRFPDGVEPPVRHDVSLVNATRMVVNRALGTELSPLDDRSYFSPWSQPLALAEVIERDGR